MLLHLKFILIGCFLVASNIGFSQLVINEVCASNSLLLDEYGESPDWIEFKNLNTGTIDLSEYYFSDDDEELLKWQMPSLNLNENEVVIFFGETTEDNANHFDFSLSSSGETLYLSQNGVGLIQTLEVPQLRNEDSFGLSIDQSEYVFFDIVSPNAENVFSSFEGYSEDPVITTEGGFFDSGVIVDITSPSSDGEIRYTLDGSFPNITSDLYTEPINIDTNSIVKAIFFEDDRLPSNPKTKSYFIGVNYPIPVVSISIDPDTLFDPIVGIYEEGPDPGTEWPYWGANFWLDKSVKATFEYFVDGQIEISQEVDLKIHGGKSSRNKPQRPFRLTAKSKYGSEWIEYPFFEEKPHLDKFKHIILRNSGADFLETNFRDGFWHQVALWEDLDIDVYGFQPCVLLINGDHWGIMSIREKSSVHYLAENYGVDEDDVLIGEKENFPFIGDTIHFFNLKEFIINEDLTNESNYDYVETQVDISSYQDYFATELFAGNPDWPANNIKFWKPSIEDGKWRWIMYDLDTTMELYQWIGYDFDQFDWIFTEKAWSINSKIFINLLENPEFKRTFINRLADLMNTSFQPEVLKEHLATIKGEFQGEIGAHFQRWLNPVSHWYTQVDEVIPGFIDERQPHVRNQVVDHFSLAEDVRLNFEVYPEGAGTININTIKPEMPFEGYYFSGNAIDLEAVANEGQVFVGWNYSEDFIENNASTFIRNDFKSSGTITAVFEDQRNDEFFVLANPLDGGMLECIITTPQEGVYDLGLYSTNGQLVFDKAYPLEEGKNKININLNHINAGVYVLNIANDSQSVREKVLVGH